MAENDAQGEWALPDGWVWTKLGECAQVITGTTPSKKDPSNYGDYLPLVKPPQLSDDMIYDAEDKLSARGAKLARVLPPQSVLVSCIGILGKTGINGVPVAFNQQINAVVFPSEILPRYGFYYLQSAEVKRWLNSVASATTVTIVNKSKFQRTHFPLAPLPEQHRIVAEIETQFTRLDAAVAGLERAQANLRLYKAAVLQAACEGRLIPTEAELARAEGRDYEPADQLLARILAERRARWEVEHPGKKYDEPAPPDMEDLPELPEGWVWAGFDSLLREPLRNGRSAKASQSDDGIRTLTLTAVTLGDFSLENTKLTVADPSKVKDLWIQPGDLFIERSNTPELVGTARLYRGKPNFAIFPDLLIRARVVDKVSAHYIEAVLQSEPTRSYFKRSAQGISGTMPKISQSTVRNLSVPLPPLAEQRRIVAEVERRQSVVGALEASVEAALVRAGRLRQAVLKQAFEGRLVPQDPDDEPASVLLERIRAQWEAEKKPKGKGGGKRRRETEKPKQLELF